MFSLQAMHLENMRKNLIIAMIQYDLDKIACILSNYPMLYKFKGDSFFTFEQAAHYTGNLYIIALMNAAKNNQEIKLDFHKIPIGITHTINFELLNKTVTFRPHMLELIVHELNNGDTTIKKYKTIDEILDDPRNDNL